MVEKIIKSSEEWKEELNSDQYEIFQDGNSIKKW